MTHLSHVNEVLVAKSTALSVGELERFDDPMIRSHLASHVGNVRPREVIA